jgi:CIC family chloride channel protein
MQRFKLSKLSVSDSQISMLLIAILIGILGGYGAVFFRFVIKLMQYLFCRNSSDILTFAQDTPFYILIGMPTLGGIGALVAGTTHAPITAILIIFELTNDYKIILPLMMSCIIASLVASYLKDGSIYTIKLMRRGLDIKGGLDQSILRTLMVIDFMSYTTDTISEDANLAKIVETFRTKDASYLHVINKNNKLAGIISFRDIRHTLGEEKSNAKIIARDVATRNVVTVTPSDNIQHALQLIISRGISQLPVVREKDSRDLLGTLREKDVLAAYDKAVLQREITSR